MRINDILLSTEANFIKAITEIFPEAKLLNGAATASVELADGSGSEFPADMQVEEKRAWAGLLALKRAYRGTEEDYENFIKGQHSKFVPLTRNSFAALGHYVRGTFYSEEKLLGLCWTVLFNDLGKIKACEDVLRIYIKDALGHDEILAGLLGLNSEESMNLLPGYNNLSRTIQRQILDIFRTNCNISDLQQLERPACSIVGIEYPNEPFFTSELDFAHTLFDVAGAAGHVSPGAERLHEQTYNLFLGLRDAFMTNDPYNNYCEFRGKLLGIGGNSPEHRALQRISALSRLGGVSAEQNAVDRNILLDAWSSLGADDKDVIVKYLSATGNSGPGFYLAFGVAMFMNPQSQYIKSITTIAPGLNDIKATQIAKRFGLSSALWNFAQICKSISIPEAYTGTYKLVLKCANELTQIDPWQVTQTMVNVTYRDSGDAAVISRTLLDTPVIGAPNFKADFEIELKKLDMASSVKHKFGM